METLLRDNYNRTFPYLRLSLTELCNFRCQYCLPNGNTNCEKNFLTQKEIQYLLQAFVDLGLQKVRLTGGEVSTRRDFTEIATLLQTFPQITDRVFTTNGYYLEQRAALWHDAGLTGVNVSVDSLDPKRFYKIRGRNCLQRILNGVTRAIEVGFKAVKINVLLLSDLSKTEFNQYLEFVQNKPICVRLIELMETQDNQAFFKKHHTASHIFQNSLLETGWTLKSHSKTAGPAMEYSHPNYMGTIGFITPYSNHFCDTCNRLRVSSTGNLHLCLFGNKTYPLRHLLQTQEQKTELIRFLQETIKLKPKAHSLHQHDFGKTPHLASIGG